MSIYLEYYTTCDEMSLVHSLAQVTESVRMWGDACSFGCMHKSCLHLYLFILKCLIILSLFFSPQFRMSNYAPSLHVPTTAQENDQAIDSLHPRSL